MYGAPTEEGFVGEEIRCTTGGPFGDGPPAPILLADLVPLYVSDAMKKRVRKMFGETERPIGVWVVQ